MAAVVGERRYAVRVKVGRLKFELGRARIVKLIWLILPWKYGRSFIQYMVKDLGLGGRGLRAPRHLPIQTAILLFYTRTRYTPSSVLPVIDVRHPVTGRYGTPRALRANTRYSIFRIAGAFAFSAWPNLPAARKWVLAPYNPSIVFTRFLVQRREKKEEVRGALSLLYAVLANDDPRLRGSRRVVFFALPPFDSRCFENLYPEALYLGADRDIHFYALKLGERWKPVEMKPEELTADREASGAPS